jgi:hypothetical protein
MINSFYFTALTSNRPIDLDQGLFFAVNWLNQSLQGCLFACIFFANQTNDLAKAQTMILVA